ncbi:TPA: hypothetical protein QDZ23_004306 [Pseudomonas putida]|nr:hypothetical protein [Pseudomonas putida]
MSIDPRDLFVSLNPLGLDERDLEKDSTGFADNRTHGDYLVFLAGFKAGAVTGEERECQRHRPINAEGCKPDLINSPFFYALAGPDGKPHYDDFCVADNPADLECQEEGVTIIPLFAHPTHQSAAALREDVERGNRIQLAMALDLSAIAQALGIPPEEQEGGAAESIEIIRELQDRLWSRDALLGDLLDHDISTRARFCIQEAMSSDDNPSTLSRAVLDLLAERRRQIVTEGRTADLDDEIAHGQLSRAAACYAISGACPPTDGTAALLASLAWPWDENWWKPTTQRRDLVKAGALILAELERLDRMALREVQQ